LKGPDAHAMVVTNTGNVGIGTTAPAELLELEGTSFPTVKVTADVSSATFLAESYRETTTHSKLQGLAARGTKAAPTPLLNGDAMLEINGASWDGTAFLTTARIFLIADGVQTAASLPSRIDLRTTPTGTTAPVSRLIIKESGNVGIGTGTPGGQFELSLDQGRKPATNTWTIVSDERLKNIEGSYTKGLSEILQLQPITYRYKNVGEREFPEEVLNTQNIGFSAQEIQKIFPEAVGTDDDGYLSFNMHAILVAYVNAIQELEAQNTALVKAMELNDAQLAAEISKMKEEHKRELAEIKSILGISAKK